MENGMIKAEGQGSGRFVQMAENLNKVLLQGDLSSLSATEKTQYYKTICETVGLNPLTKPFEFMKFQGKEVLYAGKNCAEQLRMIHSVSVQIKSREMVGDLLVVTANASTPDRRVDESIGALNIKGLIGVDLANAMMKAETKAKRRVTLSICGLNMLDESQMEGLEDKGPLDHPKFDAITVEAKAPEIQAPPKMIAQYDIANVANDRKDEARAVLKKAGAITDDEYALCWDSPVIIKSMEAHRVGGQ